mmetsp:Transcript_49369/g.107507  ORF Transcript_49369/g.107507 Transcript_49369/m.107507 type:complete len:315 (+) Transcript_49369:192-1136(+)
MLAMAAAIAEVCPFLLVHQAVALDLLHTLHEGDLAVVLWDLSAFQRLKEGREEGFIVDVRVVLLMATALAKLHPFHLTFGALALQILDALDQHCLPSGRSLLVLLQRYLARLKGLKECRQEGWLMEVRVVLLVAVHFAEADPPQPVFRPGALDVLDTLNQGVLGPIAGRCRAGTARGDGQRNGSSLQSLQESGEEGIFVRVWIVPLPMTVGIAEGYPALLVLRPGSLNILHCLHQGFPATGSHALDKVLLRNERFHKIGLWDGKAIFVHSLGRERSIVDGCQEGKQEILIVGRRIIVLVAVSVAELDPQGGAVN